MYQRLKQQLKETEAGYEKNPYLTVLITTDITDNWHNSILRVLTSTFLLVIFLSTDPYVGVLKWSFSEHYY